MSSHLLNSKNRGTLLWCKTMVRYRNCFLSSVASDCQDGRGLNLGKVWPTFSSFNALPAKVMKKISLFDIFITLQDIYVWANALSNDLSIELTWNSDILVTWALFLNLLLMFWAVIRMFNHIKVENNGVVVYVGSSLTAHNPLFFVHRLWLNKLMQCFFWSVTSKW